MNNEKPQRGHASLTRRRTFLRHGGRDRSRKTQAEHPLHRRGEDRHLPIRGERRQRQEQETRHDHGREEVQRRVHAQEDPGPRRIRCTHLGLCSTKENKYEGQITRASGGKK